MQKEKRRTMKNETILIMTTTKFTFFCIGCILISSLACSRFDLLPRQVFPTYMRSFGSSQFDVGFDAIASYDFSNQGKVGTFLVVGTSGVNSRNANGFIAKVEQKNGTFIDYKIIANDSSRGGILLNLIAMDEEHQSFRAVGFSFDMNNAADGQMLSILFDNELQNIEKDSGLITNDYNQANHLIKMNEEEIFIVGQRNSSISSVVYNPSQQLANTVVYNFYTGQYNDVLYNEINNQAITIGFESIVYNPNASRRAVIGVFDNQQQQFVCCRGETPLWDGSTDTIDIIKDTLNRSSQYVALTQLGDGSFMAVGGVGNTIKSDDFVGDGKTLITRFSIIEDSLSIHWTKIYETEFGFNNTAKGVVAVDGGAVITGRVAVDNSTDLLIAKINLDGTISWKSAYDFKANQDDFGWSIIKEEDENNRLKGFFIVGQTKDQVRNITSVLIAKTDAGGNISGFTNTIKD